MYLKIKSKYASGGVFEFRAPHAGGHVSLSVDGEWRQICHGGGFLGQTISAPENIGPACRKWVAQYRRLAVEWDEFEDVYENSCDDADCVCRQHASWPDNIASGCAARAES